MILNYNTGESVWDTCERPSDWVEFVIASARGTYNAIVDQG